jgi:hypothetical protein
MPDNRAGLTWSPSLGGLGNFNETTGVDVIDVAVNWNVLGDERMFADSSHVINDAVRLIINSVPFYELASTCAMTVLWI